MSKTPLLAALLLLALFATIAPAQEDKAGPSQPAADEYVAPDSPFDEMWLVVRSAFYDPKFHGADWDAVHEELKPRYEAAATPLERSHIINEALERLHSSHTHHYIQDQREYYEL